MNRYKEYVKAKKSRGIDIYKSPYEFYKSSLIEDKTKKSLEHFRYLLDHEFSMYSIRDTRNFSDRVKEYHEQKNNFNLISNKIFGYLSGSRILKYNKIVCGSKLDKKYRILSGGEPSNYVYTTILNKKLAMYL